MNIKRLLTIGQFITRCRVASAQEINPKVTITNLEGRSGTIVIGWYAKAESFPQKSKSVFIKLLKYQTKKNVQFHLNLYLQASTL